MMKRLSGLLLTLASVPIVFAGVPSTKFAVKSSITPPAGWVEHSTPSPDHTFTLRIGLQQPKFDELERQLYEISDPSSSRWTEHLSKEEVEDLVAPHPTSVSLFDEYLAYHGIDLSQAQRSPAQDWVYVKVTVAQAERLLNAKYSVYKHAESGAQLLRTTSYSLPEHLHEHVDVIQPTDYFGHVKAMSTSLHVEGDLFASVVGQKASSKVYATDAAAPFNVTLQTLKDLYKTNGYTPSGKHRRGLGVTGYLEQYANLADLKQFYAINLPQAVNSTLQVELINGAVNSQNISDAGVEANLDVQFAGGLSYPVPNIFYSTYGRGQNTQPNISYEDNGNEPYDVFIQTLLKKSDSQLPHTLTTSYGEDESTVPFNYARSVCRQYAQLAARGVSSLHASGDGGVGNGSPDTQCSTPNRFVPIFPGACPYVTAVGATNLIPETTVAFSGGGFSDYFARPSYQAFTVPKYIKSLGKTYHGLYNTSGRGYPDVSALGSRFEIVYKGAVGHVSGTSASTPAFAGIVALLNDALLARGRKPLGLLNPWLYSLKSGLNDITTGSNPGCGTIGFNATKGWDAATGLGTPNFVKLRANLGLF